MRRIDWLRIYCLLAVLGTSFAVTERTQAYPESVFLVVNADSWASLSIANTYSQLRGIPDSHVFCMPWSKGVEWVDDRTFQTDLLDPIFAEIRKRHLAGQIRYLIYSSDFPYVVDFSARAVAGQQFQQGSLTSMTFLHSKLADKGNAFTHLDANEYAVTASKEGHPLGFEHFLKSKQANSLKSMPEFLLSAMLGYTAGRGNSVAEINSYLRAAASADGTHPNGHICFMKNPDIRSTTRSGRFIPIVAALKKLGAQADIVEGTVPKGAQDIVGAMLGSSDFSWDPSARMLPGAICENLTSFGAIFSEGAQQTPISVLLRNGAAGSSGTVVEPYAIPQKFPDPAMYFHYRLGCTLAEAFYLAVPGPYQLLILGDPLCRPYGIFPQVELEGIRADQVCSDTMTITPRTTTFPGIEIEEVRLYLDGRFLQTVRPGESFTLKIDQYPAGYHQLSAAAIDKSSLAYVGRRIVPITFAGKGPKVEVKRNDETEIRWGSRLPLTIQAAECDRVEIRFHGKSLATWNPDGPRLEIDSRRLGLGPIALYAVGVRGGQDVFISAPLKMEIVAPKQIPPLSTLAMPVGTLAAGLKLRGGAGLEKSITTTSPANWLEVQGIPADGTFSVEGFFRSDDADVYQFRAEVQGQVTLRLNRRVIYQGNADALRYGLPVHLARGNYELACQVRLQGPPRARLEFDNRGSRSLSALRFEHLP